MSNPDIPLTEAERDTLESVFDEVAHIVRRLDPSLAASVCCAEASLQALARCDGDVAAARALAHSLIDYSFARLAQADDEDDIPLVRH